MITFWLLIDTTAMIGSPAARGAAASAVCSGRAWRGAASAGAAAVSAVRAAVAASVTIAGGAHRRTASVDWAVVHRFVMPCPGWGVIASKQRRRTGDGPCFTPRGQSTLELANRPTQCGRHVRGPQQAAMSLCSNLPSELWALIGSCRTSSLQIKLPGPTQKIHWE